VSRSREDRVDEWQDEKCRREGIINAAMEKQRQEGKNGEWAKKGVQNHIVKSQFTFTGKAHSQKRGADGLAEKRQARRELP